MQIFCKEFLRKNSREIKGKVYKRYFTKFVINLMELKRKFIEKKIEEICFEKKSSVEEITYFVYARMHFVVSS